MGFCVILILLLSASLAVAIIVPSGPDTPVSSDDPVQPGTGNQVKVIGEEDDGKTIEMTKTERFTARFLEYNNGTWLMKNSSAVKVIGDVTMESYPAQHVITLEAVQSGSLSFEFVDQCGGVQKSISVEIVVRA